MALVTLDDFICAPSWYPYGYPASLTIDADGEVAAGVWRPCSSGLITHVGFKTGSTVGGQTLRVGIQSVDASTGLHSGTWLGDDGNAGNGYGDQASPSANSIYIVALNESVLVSAGNAYAIVVTFESTAGATQILSGNAIYFPARSTNLGPFGSSYAINPNVKYTSGAPMFLVGYNGTYKHSWLIPVLDVVSSAVSLRDADTYTRRCGNRVKFAAGGRAVGIMYYGDTDQDALAVLYSDAGSVLASGAHDKDVRGATTADPAFIPFETPVTVSANTWYRMCLTAVSTTVSANLVQKVILNNVAHMGQLPLGSNCYYCAYDGTSWTDDTAQRVSVSLVFDQIEVGGGGSSGIVTASMIGGALQCA